MVVETRGGGVIGVSIEMTLKCDFLVRAVNVHTVILVIFGVQMLSHIFFVRTP